MLRIIKIINGIIFVFISCFLTVKNILILNLKYIYKYIVV